MIIIKATQGFNMWFRSFRDYPIDKPLIKYQVEPSHGIIGCEMHEINGWGNDLHIPVGKFSRRTPRRRSQNPERMDV